MFEREIQFIYDFNHNKVNRLGSFITYEQLLTADLHPAILQYISAEIDFLIYEDRQKLLKDSLLDYSGEKIGKYFGLISEEVKKSKRFTNSYIEKLILHASSFTFNYLARPKWALIKFIYEDGEKKSTAEIKQILNYIYYYPFLKNIIVTYLEKKRIAAFTQDQFENLLTRIDNLGLESNLNNVINGALDSMAEFYNIGFGNNKRIPRKAVELFLKDKNLTQHLERLAAIAHDDAQRKLEVKDFQKLFAGLMFETQEAFVEVEETEQIIEVKEPKSEIETIPLNENNFEADKLYEEEIGKSFESDDVSLGNEEEQIEELIEEPDNVEPNIESSPEEEIQSEDLHEKDIEDGVRKIIDVPLESVLEEETEIPVKVEEVVEEQIEVEGKDEDENETHHDDAATLYFSETFDQDAKTDDDQIEFEEEEIIEEPQEPIIAKTDEIVAEQQDPLTAKAEETVEQMEDSQISEEKKIEEVHQPENELIENDERNESAEELYSSVAGVSEEDAESNKVIKGTDSTIDDEDEPNLFHDDFEPEVKTVSPIIFESDDHKLTEDELETPRRSLDTAQIEISELLENKKMTKVIEVLFDYDMEDFANTVEKIADMDDKDKALLVVEELCENTKVNPNSKEVRLFKSIITEYFDRRV